MSHTAQIAADYAYHGALEAAVAKLGGRIIGRGRHKLFSSQHDGIGIQLPNWRYPIIAMDNGQLAYDHYNGRWGNVSDLDALHAEYSWRLAELAAQNVGWQTERTDEGVKIYTHSGATILVTRDMVDAQGFTGSACQDAMRQLALPLEHIQAKPAMAESLASCQEGE